MPVWLTNGRHPSNGSDVNKRTLHIAEPCHADWNAMTGDEARRFCDSCQKHVHHLSAMTRREARALVRAPQPEGLCVRYSHDPKSGQVQFRKRTITPSAPRAQVEGAARLLAGAAMVASVVAACNWPMNREAHAMMGEMTAPQPVKVNAQVAAPKGDESPPTEPVVDMGEPIEPEFVPLAGGLMPVHDALTDQEESASEHLGQFGVTLDDEEFEGSGEGCESTGDLPIDELGEVQVIEEYELMGRMPYPREL